VRVKKVTKGNQRSFKPANGFEVNLLDCAVGLQRLVDQHADIVKNGAYDLKNNVGPLHLAAARGNLTALQILLDAKAPPDALDGAGQTPLEVQFWPVCFWLLCCQSQGMHLEALYSNAGKSGSRAGGCNVVMVTEVCNHGGCVVWKRCVTV
jgi:hypothetical protein